MQTAVDGTSRIVIADRSPHVRETIRRVLCETGFKAGVVDATSFREALRIARATESPVVLLDVELAMGQPAGRLRRIAEGIAGLRVIVLLNEDLPGYRQAIADRWGYGCVAKERAEAELPEALEALKQVPQVRRA
jgi:DNA-binding NarL/FixJ family response regulator